MKAEPNEKSTLETECLFGEKVEILEVAAGWVYCKLNTDNYLGWIKKKHLGNLPVSTHRVIALRTFLYSKKNIKSNIIDYLPLGSQLSVLKIEEEWATINLSNHDKIKSLCSKNILLS